MTAGTLISKLEKVKRTGRDRWIACCPAHEDRSPSMTVRELDDGRVLVHCFAGCSVESILGAVGLDFDALFPERATSDRAKPMRRPFNAHDVLEAMSFEALVLSVAALDIGKGKALSDEARERMLLASQRIQAARDLALGA